MEESDGVSSTQTVGSQNALGKECVYYYESLKREVHTKTIYGYRCDERLKTNVKETTTQK